MIAQFVGFLLYTFCFLSIGGLIKKILNWSISYYLDYLVGFACTNAIFTIVSIFAPVNQVALYSFIFFLIVLVAIHRVWLKIYILKLSQYLLRKIKANPFIFSLIYIFITVTFFQSLYTPGLHYDTALYHIPSIRWIIEHPTLIGLANLNIVFGYNFNIFSLYAGFSLKSLFGQPIYAINFTIVSAFCLWLFSLINNSIQAKKYLLSTCVVLIFYYLIINYWPHVSTTSNDILVYILVISILLSGLSYQTLKNNIYPVVILSVYVVTIKLSAIPVLALLLFILLSKQYWHDRRKAMITTIISSLILIPWIIKNILITGWLVFPFPHLDLFSFDWQVPVSDVILQKEVIDTYYLPKNLDKGMSQIAVWFFNQTSLDILTMLLSFTLLSIVLIKVITKKTVRNQFYTASVIVSAIGIIFMFFSSPSLRYCVSFFLSAIALCVSVLETQYTINKYIFYSLGLLLTVFFLKDNWYHPWHFAKNMSHRLVTPYPIETIGLPAFNYFLIDNKVKCYYPVNTDQCFNHILPCTSHPLNNVHLRGETIEQGFYKDIVGK